MGCIWQPAEKFYDFEKMVDLDCLSGSAVQRRVKSNASLNLMH
jgi:hypothetical protein